MSRFPLQRILPILIALSLPLAAFGGDPVGKASGNGSSIDWQVQITGHERLELTVVSPDGEVFRKDFNSGRNPSFGIKDLGTEVEDGTYNYELRVVPKVSPGVAKKLENARAANDEAAARKIMKDAGLNTEIVQSGAFTILNRSIVPTDAVENDANDSVSSLQGVAADSSSSASLRGGRVGANDQVIPDDLIVQGSICAGFDCVNNESFGFDTIRMKENNTRVHFDDTSSSAGFPNNDWELTANDSASGGQNKFSITDRTNSKVPFTVEANSPANSIYTDSTGRIGFRTSTPVLDLHVATSNTPGIRLEQTNAGGFTAQTWDIAGNEANFFVRDVTGGSRLPFRIRPGAPTSSLDISASGIVGFGTASPSLVNGITTGVHISSEYPALRITATGTGGQDYQFQTGSAGQLGISDVTGGTNNNRIFIAGNGNVGIGTTTTTSKLTVAGDVRTIGGAFIDDGTTLNVPDYVFDDSYKLMSLPDLETFIRENRHLPNVPNASDVRANGLNLSEMQLRLLEKVEELTLYTLDQHRTITELKTQNEALVDRLKAIDEQLKQR